MRSWRFWEKSDEEKKPTAGSGAVTPEAPIAPRAKGFNPPAPRPGETRTHDVVEPSDRLKKLIRRREIVLFDVEQSEEAVAEDNIWVRRVATLDEAIQNVIDERTRREQIIPMPPLPVPAFPILDLSVKTGPPAAVSFQINSEVFQYEEDLDWSERGTQIVRPDLIPRQGDPESILPPGFGEDRHEALITHLRESLFGFATAARNQAIEEGVVSIVATLSDLATPCPICGGWRDWHGICQTCRQRDWDIQQLNAEENRLRSERAHELEEQGKFADRLPIAHRRLSEIDAEIAALQNDSPMNA
jgi:hypothetical protein